MHEIKVSSGTPILKGYGWLRKGDRYRTFHCRKLTHASGKSPYVVVDKGKQIGLRVPVEVLTEVNALAKQTLSSRRAATSIRDATDIAKAGAEIDVQFSKIPKKEKKAIINYGFKKHSDRVGRVSRMSLSEKVVLAIIAHVRHRYTEYDASFRSGKNKQSARKAISKEVQSVLQRWGQSKAARRAVCDETIKDEDLDDSDYVDD
jgi:hypothetical protein